MDDSACAHRNKSREHKKDSNDQLTHQGIRARNNTSTELFFCQYNSLIRSEMYSLTNHLILYPLIHISIVTSGKRWSTWVGKLLASWDLWWLERRKWFLVFSSHWKVWFLRICYTFFCELNRVWMQIICYRTMLFRRFVVRQRVDAWYRRERVQGLNNR
jgi:hypothetical protein